MRNPAIQIVAARALELGWTAPGGVDHTYYHNQAVRGLWALSAYLRISMGEPSKRLAWLYDQAASELDPSRAIGGVVALDALYQDEIDVMNWGFAAVMRWPAEVSLLALNRRRTGRAFKLIAACLRCQEGMRRGGMAELLERNGTWLPLSSGTPSARATPIRDDERARGLYLLVRATELEQESKLSPLFNWLTVQSAESGHARPVGRRARGRGVGDDGSWGK